ncbi:MAG: GYF domain-containing protein [Pirellulales bacterium]
MSTEWFCKIMGDEWGPLSDEELIAVARRGPLTRNDLVRRSGSGNWVRGEVIQGLFDDADPATIATAKRAVTRSGGLPAKRSVRQSCARKYWVQVGDHTAGPYTSSQLRELAAQGKIKPCYLISHNHIHWARASQVKGLSLGGRRSHGAPAAT